jgi:GT2 family glycosyltransferase
MLHIVIPVHNRIDLSKKCLASLDSQPYPDRIIYFVDDGSTDGTYHWLNNLDRDDVVHIKGDGSLWWTGAMRVGVDYILTRCLKNDFIMSLNNDITLESNALKNLVDNAEKNPSAIYGSVSISDNFPKVGMSSGARVISWFLNISIHPFYGQRAKDIATSLHEEVDMLTGRSVIYPVSIFLEENFNEKKFPHYGGDSEFTVRAKRAGYRLVLIPSSQVLVSRIDTGLNPMDRKLSIVQKIKSLYSVNSMNNINTRMKLAFTLPPWYARPSYLIISLIKVFLKLFFGGFIVKRREGLVLK